MIYKINSINLHQELSKELNDCYILTGNDPFILEESINLIRKKSTIKGFEEHVYLLINSKTDWNEIFHKCKSPTLFSKQRSLTLDFQEEVININIFRKLHQLLSLIKNNILFICKINKLRKKEENNTWFKTFKKIIIINCATPEKIQLLNWIEQRTKKMHLSIDASGIKLLSCYYEQNLFALNKTLEYLTLLYPENSNKTFSKFYLEKIINDSAEFTQFQWIEALLAGESIRTLHILKKIKKKEKSELILIRLLQKNLMILLNLKQKEKKLPELMKEYNIWKNKHHLYYIALNRLKTKHIEYAIHILAKLELSIKTNRIKEVWLELETISLLICNPCFPKRCIIN